MAGYEKDSKDGGFTILTPLVSLDTPGKATVRVVILADPVSESNLLNAFHLINVVHIKKYNLYDIGSVVDDYMILILMLGLIERDRVAS